MALTANAMKGFEKECLDAGFSDYFTKPIDIDSFVARLAQVLDAKPGNADVVETTGITSVTESVTETKPAEETVLKSALKDKGGNFAELADRFAARLGSQLDKMNEAWNAQDYNALAELGHWLKGAGGTVGFDVFTTPARNLESAARAEDNNAISVAMQSIWDLAARIHRVELSTPTPNYKNSPASSSSSQPSKVTNLEPVISRHAGNPRMAPLIDQFLERLSVEEQTMQEAWKSGDMELLTTSAQWLKGSGGTLGFDLFTEPALDLEAAARSGDVKVIPGLLDTLSNISRRAHNGVSSTTAETEPMPRSMDAG